MNFDTPRNPVTQPPATTLTASFVAATTSNVTIEYLGFANYDTVAHTVTVQDGAGKTFIPSESIPANTYRDYNIPEGGLYFAKGFKMMADAPSVVDAWVRYRNA